MEVDPPNVLAYTFTGGGIDTVVRYRLEAIATGTRLHIEHTGFVGIKAVLISFLLQIGVRSMYNKKLPATLQRLSTIV